MANLTPDQMKKKAFDNSPYIRLASEQSFQGMLLECSEQRSTHDPKKMTYVYLFRVRGQDKFFKSSSLFLLEQLSDYVGKDVEITRHGEGIETKYEVSPVIIQPLTSDGKKANEEDVPF